MFKKLLRYGVVIILSLILLIQIVPYGRSHANPAIVQEPQWDSAATRDLAQRACFDCHSNETVWPWYSNVAPVSWVLQRHVDEGRAELNFSTWGSGQEAAEAEELVEVIREGEMPPSDYLLLHPEARLSASEQDALVNGLIASSGGGYIESERDNESEASETDRDHEEHEYDEDEDDD